MRHSGILVALTFLLPSAHAEGQDTIRDSVISIHSTQPGPDLVRPWTKVVPRESVAPGVVSDGKRILTNAHVVHHATQILAQANGNTEKLPSPVRPAADGLPKQRGHASVEARDNSQDWIEREEDIAKWKAVRAKERRHSLGTAEAFRSFC
jgi:hypothetical protein